MTLEYMNLKPEHAPQLAELQLACFPTVDPGELFSPEEIELHYETFPEGFFVVLDGNRTVGMGAGIFTDFDFSRPQHKLYEVAGIAGCMNHNPAGAWYYGTDISVHPDYRRRGIGQKLYDLRQGVVRRYNKRGIFAGGFLPGFVNHKATMTASEYVNKVAAGELYDPTLTFQIENGFEVRGVLADYFHNEASDNWASLIVWDNPDYRAK